MEIVKKTVAVEVATLWTSPEKARSMDKNALTNPVHLIDWLEPLSYSERLELCDQNHIQSQVLYGEQVIVLDQRGNWSYVLVPSQPSSKDERGYPGWIPTVQLSDRLPDDRSPRVSTNKHAVKLMNTSNNSEMLLSYQTILPIIDERKLDYIVWTPQGEGRLSKADVTPCRKKEQVGTGDELVREAEKFIGLLYLWGGMSSYGYDCSGFSYNMARAIGCTIPRDAHDQLNGGNKVEEGKWEKGDLLFFAYEHGKGSVHHVGIYYGEGKMIHSPSTGRFIEITPLKGTIYEEELCGVVRYWGEI
ncbi:NlpC/P60 family protein [Bacillus sp. RAR_GA_16]|uniref:C40 family peptidase n=1 Tax=Bacillus sp. RAR_GA_16 TaxID=2876774 RepID=UPI001CCD246B|nr:NlpC/P60 family protein [Bacillus sp. RAR_GA_16]MCA0174136.1 NlpC/P60 family protein [Bacillus sp. RAR_GA_16]